MRPRVLVAGTKFGQVYLQAFRQRDFPFELAGILAGGSARSVACARHYGVPLFTDVSQVPEDVTLACVVIRGGLLGGPGGEVARALMERGLHVVQEHPLHHDELVECLRTAGRAGVVYHLNSFYVHTAPVRRFVAAARALLARRPARYVDAACGFQVAYALLDILGQALGGVRPWGLAAPAELPEQVRRLSPVDVPFRSVDGVLAGVPLTLRVQNQMDPADPDNYAHLLHRVTIGTEAGNLTLLGTHGPTVWSPRPDFPQQVQDRGIGRPHFAGSGGDEPDHLDVPSAQPLDEPTAPSYRDVFERVWPAGVGHALGELHRAAQAGEKPVRHGQYHLTLCRLWQDVTARLGPPELLHSTPPRMLLPADVAELADAAARAVEPEPIGASR
ncbi:Gfo/Idh/MocA family oxidoreductase [Micromonospora sp. WMMD980]|uniref:Gfo/Idh/MocA family oxidoreductase n=1 Tax=Micromonospora sp. WMMD980 TaxID=3016088 RepID=UPI002416681B|nr:Gfo/Idh/MocA family oxidoreductase [Micromonospora sp. WMMD980]MDG4800824.1 Gfo/Idh/MocA family oxidoreductase [Micromonospora sp. WMMD980]